MTEIAKIWLTFAINKVLVYSAGFLLTYGITVSGDTGQLIAGGIIAAVQMYMSQRNVKNAIKTDPKVSTEDKAGSLAVSIIAISLIPFLSGCALVSPNYSALPKDATTEEKKAAALADTKRAAESKHVQFVAKVIMTEGGKAVLSTVKDSVDREAIKDQLKSWGNAVKSKLQKGDVTVEQIEGIFETFDSKLDATKFADKFNDITDNFKDYLDELKSVDSVEIIRQWAVLMADSAISIGS
jgi:hypothetical protein